MAETLFLVTFMSIDHLGRLLKDQKSEEQLGNSRHNVRIKSVMLQSRTLLEDVVSNLDRDAHISKLMR